MEDQTTPQQLQLHVDQHNIDSNDDQPVYHPVYQPNDDLKIKLLVQPDDVQVKRVGRASCIEPELKVSLELDHTLYPLGITLNAYLKVLGKDNKHKMILLRKSDEIMLTKVHRREMVAMKLRFLKTIKVQVLKRNLGVARPEASVVFEAVNRHGEVVAASESDHFVIISDPRYLDEVKKRQRVGGDRELMDSDDDTYNPPTLRRGIKRSRISVSEYEGPIAWSDYDRDHAVPQYEHHESIKAEPSSPQYTTPSSPVADNSHSPLASPSSPPIYLTPLQTLRNISDFELFADSEEEYKLIKLVESLKYRGCSQQMCNFQVLPTSPATHARS